MKIRRFVQAALVIGVALFTMAAVASASVVNYSTTASVFATATAPGTITGGGTVLNQTSGATATLTFLGDPSDSYSPVTNVPYGHFTSACTFCSTQGVGAGAYFGAVTFDLVITDTTDVGAGMFVGS